MHGNSRGGNDTMIGGTNGALLYGDAFKMAGNTRGGDDTLISGTGTDHMWGDAGSSMALRRHPLPLPVPW